MAMNGAGESGDGVLGLFRQTAEGFADLAGKHLKLARLEFSEDLLKVVGRARVIVLLGALAGVGYALAMAGLAVLLGGNRAIGVSLLMIGGGHLGIGGLWMLIAVRRLGSLKLMDDSSDEAQRSFDAFAIHARSVTSS
jgi:hypothetical protein